MIDYIIPFFFLASGVTANKIILETWDPWFLVGIRMIIAGSILLAIALYKKRSNFLDRFKKHLPYLLLLALFATFVPALLKAFALKHTYSSKVALIGSLDPFLTALYSYFLFHEKLSLKKWIGILLGFIGTTVIIISHSAADIHELFGPVSLAELAALGSVSISRYGWIKVQQLLKSGLFNVKELNGTTMFFAGIYALLFTLIYTPTAFFTSWTLPSSTLLIYTIIGGNLIGYTLYSHLLRKHSATFVALAGFSMPLFVYLFGWFFIGEKLYPSFIWSALITFIGLIIFYQEEINQALKVK